jgi:TatD DNase family protein
MMLTFAGIMFIDIHTHKTANNHSSIINVPVNLDDFDNEKWYCVGIHPIDTTDTPLEKRMDQLRKKANKKNVLAIGECGLDRICNTAMDIQKERFVAQIQLANEMNKPLIIHCVRAHDEVLQLMKKQNNHAAAVFHGFNNNIHIAEKCLNAGHYLSFGQSIFHERSAAVFKEIPLDKIFLETDDSEIDISTIYKKAAEIREISIPYLSEQIQKNFSNLFKI